MSKLSNSEQELMSILWKLRKAFLRDLIETYPDPKPAATTVATYLKRLQNKNLVSYKTYGNSREYFPLITKESYVLIEVQKLVSLFYDESILQFLISISEHWNLKEETITRTNNENQ